MSEATGPSAGPSNRRGSHRLRWLPFWVLQAVEMAVALVFVDLSVHVTGGGLLVGAAIAYFALAVTARGPLGLLRICGQHLHLILAVTLSVALALAPIIPVLRPDIEGIIIIEFGAIGLIRVATFTRVGETSGAVPPGAGQRSSVIDANATVVDTAVVATTTVKSQPVTGDGSPDLASPGAAARWAGRAGGSAVASGRRLATKYHPEAEAQVKRTVRGAGKWAGRVAAKLAPPEDTTD